MEEMKPQGDGPRRRRRMWKGTKDREDGGERERGTKEGGRWRRRRSRRKIVRRFDRCMCGGEGVLH